MTEAQHDHDYSRKRPRLESPPSSFQSHSQAPVNKYDPIASPHHQNQPSSIPFISFSSYDGSPQHPPPPAASASSFSSSLPSRQSPSEYKQPSTEPQIDPNDIPIPPELLAWADEPLSAAERAKIRRRGRQPTNYADTQTLSHPEDVPRSPPPPREKKPPKPEGGHDGERGGGVKEGETKKKKWVGKGPHAGKGKNWRKGLTNDQTGIVVNHSSGSSSQQQQQQEGERQFSMESSLEPSRSDRGESVDGQSETGAGGGGAGATTEEMVPSKKKKKYSKKTGQYAGLGKNWRLGRGRDGDAPDPELLRAELKTSPNPSSNDPSSSSFQQQQPKKSHKKKIPPPPSAVLTNAHHSAALNTSNNAPDRNSPSSFSRQSSERDYSPLPRDQHQASVPPAIEEEDDDEDNDGLYCICETRYDRNRAMFACNKCLEWLHPNCVGISESKLELVDVFVCPKCYDKTDTRTTWKTACKTEGCFKPAVPPLTKYCSSACGIASLTALLKSHRLSLDRFEHDTLVSSASRHGGITTYHTFSPSQSFSLSQSLNNSALSASTSQTPLVQISNQISSPFLVDSSPHLKTLTQRLSTTEKQLAAAQHSLNLSWARMDLLSLASRRADTIASAPPPSTSSTAPTAAADGDGQPEEEEVGAATSHKKGASRKKKVDKGGGGGAAGDRACGFDGRLLLGGREWQEVVEKGKKDGWLIEDGTQEGGELERYRESGRKERRLDGAEEEETWWCELIRKKCDGHSSWQKLRLADFQLDHALLEQKVGVLERTLDVQSKEVKREQEIIERRKMWEVRTLKATKEEGRGKMAGVEIEKPEVVVAREDKGLVDAPRPSMMEGTVEERMGGGSSSLRVLGGATAVNPVVVEGSKPSQEMQVDVPPASSSSS